MNSTVRRVVILVASLNLAYFGVEFTVARVIGSVSLFADSIDFLEDASVNVLIAVALGWSATRRARLGMGLAGILLIPGLATLWTAWGKFLSPVPPAPHRMGNPRRHPRSLPPLRLRHRLLATPPQHLKLLGVL